MPNSANCANVRASSSRAKTAAFIFRAGANELRLQRLDRLARLSDLSGMAREGPGMTEAVRREAGMSWLSVILSARHDPAARILNVDLLAVLIAILLPWSTTGVAIAAVLWLIALIPTVEMRAFLRSLTRPICALPIALFALALAGTLWSDASWGARLYAVGPTAKLLMLPLLLYHFERSPRGVWVFVAFLASCALLMAVSWAV